MLSGFRRSQFAWIRTFSNDIQSSSFAKEKNIQRDAAFNENWSKKRVYFYQVDLRGRLFLDSPNLLRRNDATCLKTKEFLDFFFSHIKPCPDLKQPGALDAIKVRTWKEALPEFAGEYPWMSPCGRELNLLKAEDTPIVFKDLVPSEDGSGGEDLIYGGSLRERFDPSRLFVGSTTERIYYTRKDNREKCLVHFDLAQRLSKGFSPDGTSWTYKGVNYKLERK